MNKTERRYRLMQRLQELGFTYDEANQLRRIEMTLHRWAELECGDSNAHGSWCITRGRKELRHGQHSGGHGAHNVFIHDDNETPFREYHSHSSNEAEYSAIPDREKGALKRLSAILKARHERYRALGGDGTNEVVHYHQTDPRGCSLYVLNKADLGDAPIDSVYNRGVAVCD